MFLQLGCIIMLTDTLIFKGGHLIQMDNYQLRFIIFIAVHNIS